MVSGLYVPHKQAEHMAAPTEGQNVKKALAKGEPSTHGAKQTLVRLGRTPLLTQVPFRPCLIQIKERLVNVF